MTSIIIDALTHISTGPDDVVGWGPRFTAEDLLAQMDAPRKVFGEPARVDKAVAFPALGLTVPTSNLSFKEQHAYVVESVDRYPDRLIGGMVVHARLWNDDVARQVEDMVRNHNFRMLYIHPSLHKYWLPIQTPSEGEGSRQLLYPLFEAARALNIPILIHTGEQPYALPATIDFVAGQFSDVNIIIAHMGTQGEVYTLESLLVAKKYPNIYMETSFSQCHMLIESVHSIGPERVLFGSNCPPLEPTQQLMMVEESLTFPPPIGMNLSVENARKVVGQNLARLLSL
ncbi:MAG: amidohydrolase family protein [Chloroflexi bacterium]|jgi:predicted TIM-barrel fold metal-dependent hydrolase|nr:amidohydrolase family protein [Chloroflexota bacterium]